MSNPGNRLNRRRFMQAVAAATATATITSAVPGSGEILYPSQDETLTPPTQPYNVLLIIADDLNDWVGYLGGHPDTITPNIDGLAQRGIGFTNGHCPAQLCNPSRISMLTGLHPSRTGIYANDQPMRYTLPDAVTLPQHFKNNGYRAIGGGKVFHSVDPQSWDDYYPALDKWWLPSPLPSGSSKNGIPNANTYDWGVTGWADEDMGDMKLAAWAAGELSKPQDKPFFMALGTVRPHVPWYVPKTYFDRFPADSVSPPLTIENDLDDLTGRGLAIAVDGFHQKVLEYDKWQEGVAGCLASINFTDAVVGKILDALFAGPHAENTIVIFVSDNGFHMGEKQRWGKWSLWEDMTRVPYIIYVPGMSANGATCAKPVTLTDLYPTLIDLCGLPAREELNGTSLVPLLEDPQTVWERPALITLQHQNHAIRSEHFRYIRYQEGVEELYDHRGDPHEWNNLAGDPAYAAVKEELVQWLPEIDMPFAPRPPATPSPTPAPTSMPTPSPTPDLRTFMPFVNG